MACSCNASPLPPSLAWSCAALLLLTCLFAPARATVLLLESPVQLGTAGWRWTPPNKRGGVDYRVCVVDNGCINATHGFFVAAFGDGREEDTACAPGVRLVGAGSWYSGADTAPFRPAVVRSLRRDGVDWSPTPLALVYRRLIPGNAGHSLQNNVFGLLATWHRVAALNASLGVAAPSPGGAHALALDELASIQAHHDPHLPFYNELKLPLLLRREFPAERTLCFRKARTGYKRDQIP